MQNIGKEGSHLPFDRLHTNSTSNRRASGRNAGHSRLLPAQLLLMQHLLACAREFCGGTADFPFPVIQRRGW
jgi:hypothetical protein